MPFLCNPNRNNDNNRMKKLLYALLAGVLACHACVDDNSRLGSSLVESSFHNVFTSSCSVDLSTILMDSIETREDTVCHFGHYQDTAWGEVSATYYAEYSTNSFNPNLKTDSRIDHVFISKQFTVKKYGVLTDTYRSEVSESQKEIKSGNFPKEVSLHKYQARTPSDHFPVMVVLTYKK